MGPDRAAFHIDAAHGQGQQIGDRNTQHNHYYSPVARTTWPLRVGVVPPLADCLQDRCLEKEILAARPDATTMPARVLSGMGGVGKTQLAAAHAERLWQQRSLDVLIWVPARSRSGIVDSYTDAAGQLGIDEGLTGERAAVRLLNWLAATDKRWLVVLDDMADPDDLRDLWPPQNPAGSTVATTRSRDAALTGAGRRLVQVGLFTSEQARDYLAARLADRPALADDIDGLAADLGYLPLALAQAAVYLINQERPCSWYRSALADRSRHLSRLAPRRLPDQHRDTVAAAWSLSIEQADCMEPIGVAQPLLQLASLLDPDGIPAAVLTEPEVLAWLDTETGTPVGADEVHDAIRNLHLLNLATHDPDSPTWSLRVHALVQRATHDQTPPERLDTATRAAADALKSAWPPIETDPELGQVLRANTFRLHHIRPDPLWTDHGAHLVLFAAGRSLGETGQVAEAADYYLHLHTDAQRRLGPGHPDTLAVRANLAYWRGEAGDAAGAATSFEHLLADTLRVLGPDHPHTLRIRANLARWRGEAGDPAGAATVFEHLLADSSRLLGPDDLDTLTARANLAWWRGMAGDRTGVAAALEPVLAEMVRVLGPDHPDTLTTRHNLAYWRGEAGDPAGAATATEHLLADRLRVLGPDHPQTLTTRHNLAEWRGEAGDPADAATAFEHLLADTLRVLGPDHPDTLTTRANLARWRMRSRDPAVVRRGWHG